MKRSGIKRSTKRMAKKPRKGDNPELRKAYRDEHLSCGLCWARLGQFGVNLECHHILGGSFKRIDDLANLLMLCKDCHQHHTEDNKTDDNHKRWPKITVGMILTCKREADPEQFSLERIAEIAHRAPGAFECETIDPFYLALRERA